MPISQEDKKVKKLTRFEFEPWHKCNPDSVPFSYRMWTMSPRDGGMFGPCDMNFEISQEFPGGPKTLEATLERNPERGSPEFTFEEVKSVFNISRKERISLWEAAVKVKGEDSFTGSWLSKLKKQGEWTYARSFGED